MRLCLLLLIGFLAISPAVAKDPNALVQEYRPKDNVEIAPDMAYILVRSINILGFRFVRMEQNAGQLDAQFPIVDRSNFAELAGFKSFAKVKPLRYHLLAIKPGSYWLYGEKTDAYLEGPFLNCLCMGTLKFVARAGVVTDLGLIRNLDRETKNGRKPDFRGNPVSSLNNKEKRAIYIEPIIEGEKLPSNLEDLPRELADYRATGFLPNVDGTLIDRISEMPGVIAYEGDSVIDVRSGKTLR